MWAVPPAQGRAARHVAFAAELRLFGVAFELERASRVVRPERILPSGPCRPQLDESATAA
jgi:hypothetical protein